MTKKYLLIALATGAGFLANAETADNSRIPSFAVPVLTGDYADPSIIKVEGMYYMTHTFGGFLALRPAIYCSGEGRAIFRAFKVVPLR